MNKIIELKAMCSDDKKKVLVKRFLLACCEKMLRFRTGDCLPKNLEIARRFIKGFATKKQIHQAEWEIEGEAFGAEHYSERSLRVYYRVDKAIKTDLTRVRISMALNSSDARTYLTEIAYFIDHVFCYIQFSPDWFFQEKDEKFLCPRLFKRFFG